GLLVVLEAMTPAERVALILHDVFGYPFAEVAQIVGRTPAACRQLASSARRRVRAARAPAAPAARQAGLVRAFKPAWEAQDIGALIRPPHPHAPPTRPRPRRARGGGGGGGRPPPPPRPIEGGGQIARYLADLARAARGNVRLLERSVNGQPGLVAQLDGVTVAVYAFEVAGDRIKHIW